MQPPLSQRIRRLEDRVGHPLFTRGPGRVGLMPAGEELLLPALLHRFRERSPGVQLH
ncbi:MAG: LysR family transcriptional regulator, partial [Catenulispora sp.]|nr:LysR family transcriptional regulator [Catenulispora sp.]